jgi:ATP-binding cassette subfamily C protein
MVGAVVLGVMGHLSATAVPVLGVYALLENNWKFMLALMLTCGLLRGVFRYGEQTLNHYIAFKLLALIRQHLFSALRRLTPAKLEDRNRGELVNAITSDVELLEIFYAHTISPSAIALLVSAIASAICFIFHPLLGLLAMLGYLVVGVAIPLGVARFAKVDGGKSRTLAGQLSTAWLDTLRGLPELSQFGQTKNRGDLLADYTVRAHGINQRMGRHEGIASALSALSVTGFSLVVLVVGFQLWQSNTLDLVGAILPCVILLSSFGPVIALAALGGSIQPSLAAGKRVLSILDETPQTEEIIHGATPDFQGAASQALCFSYGQNNVLNGLTAHLKMGEITGISGKSGAGKSTFLKLLMRFWDISSGKLTISETPISCIQTDHLRKTVAYMTQDADIFHDTIAANIAIGNTAASRDEIIRAAHKAALHEFVCTLPNGYDTQIGELGSTLSAGQRQRIALARAFLSGAPLLLLDEPTSSLDALNEGAILKALVQECRDTGRTVALVSHRASSLGVADQQFVI